MPRKALSLLFLLGVNTVPIFGVAFFGWNLFSIMLLYWLENGIIGVFNVPKILLARGPVSSETRLTVNGRPAGAVGKWFIVPFFVFHYGLFWVVHGVFVVLLFGVFGGRFLGGTGFPEMGSGFSGFDPAGFGIAALSLLVSHGVSFFANFVGGREYESVSPDAQMFRPYPRVMVLHVTILGGGFLAGYLGAPLASLVLLVALKTAVDVWAHLREHRGEGAGGRPDPREPSPV